MDKQLIIDVLNTNFEKYINIIFHKRLCDFFTVNNNINDKWQFIISINPIKECLCDYFKGILNDIDKLLTIIIEYITLNVEKLYIKYKSNHITQSNKRFINIIIDIVSKFSNNFNEIIEHKKNLYISNRNSQKELSEWKMNDLYCDLFIDELKYCLSNKEHFGVLIN
jgi:hypothetical protein